MTGPYKATADRFAEVVRKANQDEKVARNSKTKAAMESLIDDPSWLTEDLLTRDLPEISPETEAEFLAEVEADLDERYGPKKG